MNLGRVLRISRWEATRGIGGVDRRTAITFAFVAALVVGVAPLVAADGAGADDGLYRVAVDPTNEYAAVVESAARLRRVPASSRLGSGAELRIREDSIVVADSATGQAALATFRQAIAAYNDQLMAAESHSAVAFPVRVSLRYADQTVAFDRSGTEQGPDQSGESPTTGPDRDTTEPSTEAGDGGGITDAITSMTQALLGGQQTGTPGTITPPVPVKSLILAFLFVVPLNVVIQAFGSGVMTERLNRRGEPLLVSPATRYEVVAGKTLPYLLAAIAIATLTAIAVGGSAVSVIAVVPLALLFLSTTFLAAMVARSYRELSFLTVAISVGVTTYAFVPAIFTEIAPVAAISPLSLVVYDLAGDPIRLSTLAFATIPPTVLAATVFALGVGLFREETLFGSHAMSAKLLDAFAVQLTGRGRIAIWSALLVPFVFLAELLTVALLVAVKAPITVVVLLSVVAVIEESAKSIHIRAGFVRDRLTASDRTAVWAGIQSGVGFAIAEKVVLVVQVVGLGDLALARAAFAPVGIGTPIVVAGLLAAPFMMHSLTTVVSAVGARRSRPAYLLTLGVAMLLHLIYDLAVVTFLA